jgi:single-stranded-DNA-specific exonuclease
LAATARRIRRRPLPTHAADWPGVPPLLQRVYAQRGVDDAAQLNLDLAALLPPGDLLGVEAAAGRLQQALEAAERVLVVGDFDADGATSSALAVAALREFGFADVDFLVPNRFDYGYGLTPEIVALCRAARALPDCDRRQRHLLDRRRCRCACGAGMDVLVTDHHLPGEVLPQTGADRQPEPARLRLSQQAPRGGRGHVLSAPGPARPPARAGLVHAGG